MRFSFIRAFTKPICASLAIVLVALAAVGSGCGQKGSPPQQGAKVLIVGIDAADMLILDRLRERGEVPNFERFFAEGSTGLLRSLEPILSPLLWTSIATGKTPDKHGILDFLVMDQATGQAVPVTSRMRRVRALWNIAGAQDRTVAFVGWLATWPSENVNGIMISDRLSYHSAMISDESRSALCSPPSYVAAAESVEASVLPVPLSSMRDFVDISQDELERARATSYDISNPVNNLRLIYITSETYRRLALKILADEKPDLMGVYFEETDSVGHLFVPYEPPRMPGVTDGEMQKFGGAMDAAYRHIDRVLGDLMEAAGDEYDIILLSDHGFKTGPSRPQSAPPPREPGAARWHRLNGVLLMLGPQIKRGVTLHGASVLDITPTVLALMGLPVARDMDGKPITEAIDDEFLRAHPIRAIDSYEVEGEKPNDLAESETGGSETAGSEVDEQMLARLKALGYIGAGSGDQGEQSGAPGDEPAEVKELSTWHSNRGVTLLREGRYREAEEAFAKAVEGNPESPVTHNNLGLARLELGKARDAEESFKRAIDLDPGYVNAHVNLAILYDRTRRDSLAVREYRRALELEPSKASVHGALGNFYAKRGRFAEALPHLRRANQIEPQSSKLRLDYGAACWKTGDLPEAAVQFEKAVSLDPSSAQAQLLLAQSLMALGRGAEAREHLQECLRIDPNNREAKRLLGQ
jgi:Tfp pilus assembly protein PilF